MKSTTGLVAQTVVRFLVPTDYDLGREQLSADATELPKLFSIRTIAGALFWFGQESSLRLLRQWRHSLDDRT